MLKENTEGENTDKKMLEGLTKLNEGEVTDALKATRNRDARKVMNVYVKERGP